jgi:hypothetical protein
LFVTVIDCFMNAVWPGFDDHDVGFAMAAVISGFVGDGDVGVERPGGRRFFPGQRSIAAALAGDTDVAERVELNLPETGMCWTDLGGRATADTAASSGRGTPAGVGFTTGSEHGYSAEEPATGSCCGSTSQPVSTNAPTCGS